MDYLLISPLSNMSHSAYILLQNTIKARGSPENSVSRGREKENIENPTFAGLLCVLAHFAVVFPRGLVSGVRAAPQASGRITYAS